jgi:diaminohydroxyphosphoribosylaminopyrimidine deaminase/5-amino-6-(5-phosphoribosylamino)uracil reductase
MTASLNFEKIEQLEALGVEVYPMPTLDKRLDLNAVLQWLGKQQVNELLVETGATLAGRFIKQNLVNQLIVYTAPIIMGSSAQPLFKITIDKMQDKIVLKKSHLKQFGKDLRVISHLF